MNVNASDHPGDAAGPVATVGEAAYVAGVSRHAVNQAIDRREIRSRRLRRARGGARRAVGGPELVYLRVHGVLSARARRALYRALAGRSMDSIPTVVEMEGDVRLDLGPAVAEVRARLDEVARLHEHVEEDPAVRGGEPVFRGTRVPVHMVADFLAQGVSREELLEDYPALREESLDAAVRFAALHPPLGRPKKAPWRAGDPARILHPGDAG